ncbi:hypothetical protein GCM10019059_12550 [Camelimonas fluminis]|nr:hypothetical protein GCM10019059_12550 [Camelimonas fluminis]
MQTGGIKQPNRQSTQIKTNFENISRRARNVGDNRHIPASEAIEERRFSGIRRTSDDHPKAVAHTLPNSAISQHCLNFVTHLGGDCQCRHKQSLTDVIFVREIDVRLNQGKRIKQPIAPPQYGIAQGPIKLRYCLASLGCRFRFNQVGQRLGLGQIKLSCQDSSPRELSGLREPETQMLKLKRKRVDQKHIAV